MRKRILSVCGTGGVTSSVIALKMKEIAQQNDLDVEIANCKVFEVKSKVANWKPDLIVASTRVPDVGVPVVKGFAFLSGVGEEEAKAQILDILRQDPGS